MLLLAVGPIWGSIGSDEANRNLCCVTLTGPDYVIEWDDNTFYATPIYGGGSQRIYKWYIDDVLVRNVTKSNSWDMHADTLTYYFESIGADEVEVSVDVFYSSTTQLGTDTEVFPVHP